MPYYGPMQNYGYQPYQPAVPDQLAQLRQPYQGMNQQFAVPIQNSMTQPPQDQSGIIWVQGEAGAKAYMVAAGNTVVLWDSESNTIYLKSADASGVPSMRILDWTERTAQSQNVPNRQVQYVTSEQFNALVQDFNALNARFNALTNNNGGEANAQSAV